MSYQGLIAEIPIGADGLTGNKNLSQVRPSQLLQATNITYESGTIQKEGGASKFNSSAIAAAPSVIGGWDWWPSDGVQRQIVVTSAGDILKDSGAWTFPTTLKSGLTVSDVVPVFVEGGKEAAANNRKLFIFTGKNQVQVVSGDGASTTNLAIPPADWTGANQPIFGVPHEGRMFSGGNLNDPHRLYYPTTTNHEDYTGAGSGTISIYPGEGERLIGGLSFKGFLIVWKSPLGIYLVDTTDPTISNWKVKRLTDKLGMRSPLAAVVTDNDILFKDQNGDDHLLTAVSEFGDIASSSVSNIADMGPFIRENINFSKLANARAIYYAAKREAHFALAGAGSSTNNRRMVIDFNRRDLIRFRWSERDTCESLWLRKDANGIPRPVSGDNAGFVWDMDKASRSKDGAGYNGQFQTAHTDLSYLDPKLGTMRKDGDFLELVVEPKGNWNLNVDVLWDGSIRQTVTFNMGQTGAGLGSFVLGTDVLAGDQVLNKKRRIAGGGRRLSLIGRNSGAGEDFSVARFFLHFRPGDERLQ